MEKYDKVVVLFECNNFFIISVLFFLLIFIYRQLKLEEPLLNLDVFKSKVFTFSTIIVMMIWIYMLAYIIVMGIAINVVEYKEVIKKEKM